jgi:hypothetical protein
MDFLNKLDLKPSLIAKAAGIALAAIVIVAFAIMMINSSIGGLGVSKYDAGVNYGGGAAYQKMSESAAYDSYELSARNVDSMTSSQTPSPSGNTAEDYEITEYSAEIETRDLEKSCREIISLKPRDYVIFEDANEYDKGCSYVFKVASGQAEEILNIVKGLDPKNLTENTQTIKKRIDDFTSQEEILTKKKETIEETLNNAIKAYDEIAALATQTRDV